MTASKSKPEPAAEPEKIPNGKALDAIDYAGLTERQLGELEAKVRAERGQRTAARNITLAETVAGYMPTTSAPPLAER
jgi:hypothetical protein